MTVADNAVDRPLVDVVINAIDADKDLSNEAECYVLDALEGPTSLQELLDGISTPHVPEPSSRQLVEQPVGAFSDVDWCGADTYRRPSMNRRRKRGRLRRPQPVQQVAQNMLTVGRQNQRK